MNIDKYINLEYVLYNLNLIFKKKSLDYDLPQKRNNESSYIQVYLLKYNKIKYNMEFNFNFKSNLI